MSLSAQNNHRAWHPVMGPTGRTAAIRNMDAANFLAPFADTSSINIGNQTMLCSDCHGSNTENGISEPIGGEDGSPWGPHGSSNDFLLKGPWDANTGYGEVDALCFKCHAYADYAYRNNSAPGVSGFRSADDYVPPGGCGIGWNTVNLHIGHAQKIGTIPFRCSWCHAAVPHGWKNKALLVSLFDVGPEVGEVAGTMVEGPYTNPPYYMNAILRVTSFAKSGEWESSNCASTAWMIVNCPNPP